MWCSLRYLLGLVTKTFQNGSKLGLIKHDLTDEKGVIHPVLQATKQKVLFIHHHFPAVAQKHVSCFHCSIFHISTARANQVREYIYIWSRCNSKRLRMCCKTLFSLSLLPFVESDMDLAQVKVILHIENGHVLLFLGRLPVQEKNDLKLVQFFVLDVLLYRDFFDILQ